MSCPADEFKQVKLASEAVRELTGFFSRLVSGGYGGGDGALGGGGGVGGRMNVGIDGLSLTTVVA